MNFKECFPIWDKLTPEQQNKISKAIVYRHIEKGTMLYNGLDCTGLLLIKTGQLRAYILSDEGREITLYRLLDGDICLFSASCIMNSLQFTVNIVSEKNSEVWVIPPDVYKNLMENSAAVANYTNELMASRFSEVMWLIEQIMWKSLDKRLAAFLVEETSLENATSLKITHEIIANHLGSAREVVTRMLRYFQNEGIVKLTRGTVEILDLQKLKQLSI